VRTRSLRTHCGSRKCKGRELEPGKGGEEKVWGIQLLVNEVCWWERVGGVREKRRGELVSKSVYQQPQNKPRTRMPPTSEEN